LWRKRAAFPEYSCPAARGKRTISHGMFSHSGSVADPDSHQIERWPPDPYPHQSDKLDPDPHRVEDDKPKIMEYEPI